MMIYYVTLMKKKGINIAKRATTEITYLLFFNIFSGSFSIFDNKKDGKLYYV
jgi:hypothetical protein